MTSEKSTKSFGAKHPYITEFLLLTGALFTALMLFDVYTSKVKSSLMPKSETATA